MRPFNSREKDMKAGRCIRMDAEVRFAARRAESRPWGCARHAAFPRRSRSRCRPPRASCRRTRPSSQTLRRCAAAPLPRPPRATLTRPPLRRRRSIRSRSTSPTTPSTPPPPPSARSRPCGRTSASASSNRSAAAADAASAATHSRSLTPPVRAGVGGLQRLPVRLRANRVREELVRPAAAHSPPPRCLHAHACPPLLCLPTAR